MSSGATVAYLLALASTIPVALTVGSATGSIKAGCAAVTIACFLICLSIAHRSRP